MLLLGHVELRLGALLHDLVLYRQRVLFCVDAGLCLLDGNIRHHLRLYLSQGRLHRGLKLRHLSLHLHLTLLVVELGIVLTQSHVSLRLRLQLLHRVLMLQLLQLHLTLRLRLLFLCLAITGLRRLFLSRSDGLVDHALDVVGALEACQTPLHHLKE